MKSKVNPPAGGQKSKVRVAVAMSGGVDSSVAAALLKKQGFTPQGVFLRLFDSEHFRESEKRAKRIAGILKIPFFILDLKKEFKEKIIKIFLGELEKGKTPNPCVLCNKEIKFGILFKKLRELKINFDFIATGHYAKSNLSDYYLNNFAISKKFKLKIKLLRGKDKEKDQSYFLWMLNQYQLKHLLFPLGDYTKKEVKNLAKKFGLPVFSFQESQEICFIQKDLDDFLRENLKTKKGNILDAKGKIIGEHKGLWFYTIGQRKGIGIGGGPAFAKLRSSLTVVGFGRRRSAGKPYYVLDKDLKKNILIVTKNERDLYKKELMVNKINWISGKEPELPLKVKVKIRYKQKMVNATLKKQKIRNKKQNLILVGFNKAQRAITPGQSAVFYRNQEILGGGIIEN